MDNSASNLQAMIASMLPTLNPEGVAFVCLAGEVEPPDIPGSAIIGTFREPEGLTVFVDLAVAEQYGLDISFRAAWITLTLQSDLSAVGLTAMFAGALGEAGISCNVVAATYHDHIFVPIDAAHEAIEVLLQLQRDAALGQTTRLQ